MKMGQNESIKVDALKIEEFKDVLSEYRDELEHIVPEETISVLEMHVKKTKANI